MPRDDSSTSDESGRMPPQSSIRRRGRRTLGHTPGMTTVVKAKDPASFLRLVPVMAGFTPRQSIALVPFRRKRSAAVMRMDIPRASVTDRLDGVPDFAEAAMALIERVPGADGVAIVVYTDDEPADTPEGVVLPHEELVEALRDAADDHDLRLIEALCVTPDGWGDYLDELPQLQPVPDAATEAELGLEDRKSVV